MHHLDAVYYSAASKGRFATLDDLAASRYTGGLHQLLAMKELEAQAKAGQKAAVDQARTDGVTWDQIAEALGVTRSAAIQKFNKS